MAVNRWAKQALECMPWGRGKIGRPRIRWIKRIHGAVGERGMNMKEWRLESKAPITKKTVIYIHTHTHTYIQSCFIFRKYWGSNLVPEIHCPH
jgi:hypothetical protein